MSDLFPVRISAVEDLAEGIKGFELTALDGGELPPFTAGSHIDVKLRIGLQRSYSLVNPPSERNRYVLGIALDANSRGASRYIHRHFAAGEPVLISPPRNLFPLADSSAMSIFIAGGIGITPFMSMQSHLNALGRPWTLYYCARNPASAAYRSQLLTDPRVHCHFDSGQGGRLFDIAAIVASAPSNAHFYCCGPAPMLDAFMAATAAIPAAHKHVEYFAPRAEAAVDGGFKVELARSGKTLSVAPGKTIIETLREAGIQVPHSCMQGVCGTCEVPVLSGIPDHRDSVLSDTERAAGRSIMVCCSGAQSDTLVLDL